MAAEILSLESHKRKKAAERGFMEWNRLFQSVAEFHESTKWADLPDAVVLFFCEESPESRHSFYDLIMRTHRLGNGADFEAQPYDRLATFLNAYFFIMDQARFECMRRLGWLETIPRADKSIIQVVMDPETYEHATLLETPEPTPAHPGFEEDVQSRGIDRAAAVRKHAPEAIRRFREKAAAKALVTR